MNSLDVHGISFVEYCYTVDNRDTTTNMSDSRLVLCELSRWRFGSATRIVFMLIVAMILPCAYSDDSQLTNQGTRYQIAHVNISYVDLDTNTEVVKHYEGKYGQQSSTSVASGVVLLAKSAVNKYGKQNSYGCTNYSYKKFPAENWIALVERGECSFSDKIRIAIKDHSALAIVIYNNSSEDNIIMHHDQGASIAVLLKKVDGNEIAGLLERGCTVYLHMYPGGFGTLSMPLQNNGISKTSVLFVSISFIVLMIVSLAWLVFYYIQRFRYSHAKERLARRLACAAKKAIVKIPQRTLKMGDKELDSDYDQCAVCIESYRFHEVIRILPCHHVFHKSCVDPWLLDQRSCPMCKMDILRAYGMQVGGSQESLHPNTQASHVTTVTQEEPEIGTSVEEIQADSVRVTLVPQSCLHFCSANQKTDDSEKASSDHLQGAVGGSAYAAFSTNSLNSKGNSHSRAEKSDRTESVSSEMKALLGKGKAGKRRWRSEEACNVGDEGEATASKDPDSIVVPDAETASEDPNSRKMLQP